MWKLESHSDFEKRLKKFLKKHRQETLNALDNLNAYHTALQQGLKPQQIIRGFIHHEGMGIRALDQSGPGKPRKALRLYIYPDENSQILYVLTLGDKSSQSEDIRHTTEFVESVRKDALRERTQPDETSAEDAT